MTNKQNENKNLEQEQEEMALVAQDATINLPILAEPEEAKEIIAENLEGMEVRFDKVTIPSGGGLAFTMINEEGEEEPIKELKGVILNKQPFKAYYEKSFDEKEEDDPGIPDCFSPDGKVSADGYDCSKCPKGQWGSDRNGGRGKDCNDKVRVYILPEGNVFPIYIDLPPTSISNFTNYVKRLANKLLSYYGVVTSISLEKDKSDSGIQFSKAKFAKAADLSKEEKKAIKEYITSIKPQMQITQESIGEVVAETDESTEATEYEAEEEEVLF